MLTPPNSSAPVPNNHVAPSPMKGRKLCTKNSSLKAKKLCGYEVKILYVFVGGILIYSMPKHACLLN